MEINEITERLDRDNHPGDGFFVIESLTEKLLKGLIGTLAELSQEFSIKSEMGPQHLGYRGSGVRALVYSTSTAPPLGFYPVALAQSWPGSADPPERYPRTFSHFTKRKVRYAAQQIDCRLIGLWITAVQHPRPVRRRTRPTVARTSSTSGRKCFVCSRAIPRTNLPSTIDFRIK
jgi:hypothetical protein